ncbi:MAG TPA: hypothetical protein VHN14_17495 [Kofleriaceae bacterium]|nr:hypothetical protein [Kofleriaceae bacterium]
MTAGTHTRRYGVHSRITTLWFVLIALIILGATLLMFYIAVDREEPWKTILNNIAGAILTVAVLSIVWEVRGKRLFADEMLELVGLSYDVDRAGIQSATREFHQINWKQLIGNAKEADIFVSFARTWREAQRQELAALAKRADSIRIALPDPENASVMAELARRFKIDATELRGEIVKAKDAYREILQECRQLTIYGVPVAPTYTYYRFGDRIIVTFYTHRQEKTTVPTMVFSEGTFFEFFRDDFNKMLTLQTTRSL